MRIDDKKDAARVGKKEKRVASKGAGSAGAPLFAGKLTQVVQQGGDYAGALKRLKEEVDRAGDVLEQEPTIANFKVFRELLATLAKKVSSEAYRVEILGSSVGGRAHEVISVIDKEADLLYHLVMREQKDHIRIVGQILKIKGLVVDLML
jgi:uncharacterized protein